MRSRITTTFLSGLLLVAGMLVSRTVQSRSLTLADSLSLSEIQHRASSINSLSSLLIQQKGQLLSAKYYNGLSQGETTNLKSASKSIISLLIGIAIDKGYIESLDQTIEPYFKNYFAAHPDSVKENITLKDLITMRSGLETTSFHNYGRWVTSDNWVRFALDQPMEGRPGGDMAYSTGTSHLLSVILTKATGMSTKAFAEKYLFEPMDIEVGGWDRDPQGYYMGGNNLALSPRDMLKIGQMILDDGIYQGQRIISSQWLQDSFRTYTRSNYNPYNYGYMWWKKPVGQYQVHFAWGYGGQYIFMIPALDAVVVMTGSLRYASQSRSYRDPVFSLLRKDIIPMLQERLDN